MGNMIPQKSFDKQMHIIRDVHFDVDKYKIGELYAIKHKVDLAHTVDDKIVGELTAVNPTMLRFNIFIGWCKNSGETAPKPERLYSIEPLELSINEIIDKRIEIERLMTETEAAVYLMGAISKESAKDIVPEPALADKYKGDLSHFILPNSFACGEKYLYADESLKYIGPNVTVAYKNDKDEAKELIENGPMKIVEDVVRKCYVTNFDGKYEEFIVGNRINVYAFHGLTDCKRVNIRLVKGKSTIDINLSSNKLSLFEKSIHIGGGACSIDMELHVDSIRDMFDEIVISDKQ